MRAIEGLRRSGVAIGSERTILDAARIMEEAGVGALAVLEGRELVGIVTDRDLVRRCLARGLPADGRVDAVMSAPVVTMQAEADLHEAFALFRRNAIRRIAVVRAGEFVGMISIDDLTVALATDFVDLVSPVADELQSPHHDSAVPATTT